MIRIKTNDFRLMKRLLSLLTLWLVCLAIAQAAKVEYKVTGVQSGDKAVVSIGSDAYLATTEVSADGSYSFDNVPAGKMFLKIEASGYHLPQALTVIVNEDGSIEPMAPQTLAITKMDADPNTWTHSWQEDGSLSGYTTTASINKRPEIEFLGKKIVPSDVPSVGMLYQYYHVILSDEGKAWTQEYAYRLYETLKTIPYAIGEGYSKFILTEDKIDDDIKVETSGNSRIVTIGEDAFYYANPFLVNLDGVRGRFFSKRLHHALVNYATNFGEDEGQVNQILTQRFACTMEVPDYKALTAGITNEDEFCFQKFLPTERVAIINMLEELPEGFHKTPHLNYLVRRLNGHNHPLYPDAAAVSWCVDNGYIEFMESSFGGNNQDFKTQRLILHEKTHFLWAFTLSDEIKNDWIKVGGWYKDPNAGGGWSTTKDVEFVTAYAHGINPNEDMAESVAYYIKDPEKLRSRALEKYEFIRDRIMNGTRYISKIPDHLTFEVLNLNPDYDYPGKIKRLEVKVEGAPDEDKKVIVEIELNHIDGFEDGASGAITRISSPSFVDTDGMERGQFYDMWMYPVNDNMYLLRGEITISKYSKTGYWVAGDISTFDEQGNQRLEGRNDCVWNMFINNSLEDIEAPKYESGSLKYELSDIIVEGRHAQKLHISFRASDNIELTGNVIRLGWGETAYCLSDRSGEYDKDTKTVSIDYIIPDYYKSADYNVTFISLWDKAGNETFRQFSESPTNEPVKYIHISTTNPDTKAPDLDLNRITVYAEPTHPETPDGETLVTISCYVRDDISGYNGGTYGIRDPQGNIYSFGLPGGDGFIYYVGNPNAWRRLTTKIVLPQGSAPGIWGVSHIEVHDKAINVKTYNFVETVIFEPDDNLDDYILLSDIKDNELTLKMTKTEGNGYSYGYRIINEDTGEEISGEMNAQTTNKARRTRSSDSSVMDADYAAIIDVSELSDGNCIAIVQVKNEEGKAVAVRNTRFVKGTSTSISNIVEGKYDKLTPIYDLQGRKITVPAKGVYIQNGRKFVVK